MSMGACAGEESNAREALQFSFTVLDWFMMNVFKSKQQKIVERYERFNPERFTFIPDRIGGDRTDTPYYLKCYNLTRYGDDCLKRRYSPNISGIDICGVSGCSITDIYSKMLGKIIQYERVSGLEELVDRIDGWKNKEHMK